MSACFHTYQSLVRLVRYATRPPLQISMPPVAAPANVDLGGKVQFLGSDALNRQADPGKALGFSVYLRNKDKANSDVKVSLRLVDDLGQTWAQADQVVGGSNAEARWPENAIIREDIALPVPPATPPGDYNAELVVYPAATGQPYSPPDGSAAMDLGRVQVGHASTPPALSTLPLTARVSAQAGPLRIVGLDMGTAPVSQGGTLPIDIYWQVNEHTDAGGQHVVSLVDSRGRMLVEQTCPIGSATQSASTWRPGEIVRSQCRVALPKDAAPGDYALRVAVRDPVTGEQDQARRQRIFGLLPGSDSDLASVSLWARDRTFAAPAPEHVVSANFGDQIMLLGYDVLPSNPQTMRPGQSLNLTFVDRALAPMATDYTIFVHLADDRGKLWGQHDQLAGGTHPTSMWLAAEVVSTTLTIPIAADAPAGRLTVSTGLYDAASQKRLPVIGTDPPSDSIALFAIEIVR